MPLTLNDYQRLALRTPATTAISSATSSTQPWA